MKRATLHLALILTASTILSACERPHTDMGQQDKYNTYGPTDFFADGASERPLVPGVVARDEPDTVAADTTIPFPITGQVLLDGEKWFNIACAVCHGRLGNGEGMIIQRGFTRPPSFHVPRLEQIADAHFFNVITNGYGAMFSQNDRVPVTQRWEIVAYIRALQAAPNVPGINVSDADRRALVAGGDRKTPTTGETR